MRAGFFLFFLILTTSVTAQSGPCSGHGEFIQTGQWLGGMAWSMGVDVGDVNSDGHPDLVFARDHGLGNQVYLGDGSGLFTDTGQSLGTHNSHDIALADLDMDGDLDMVVANTQVGGPGQPNRIYFNDGLHSGNFIDSGQSLGNEASQSVATGDINGDSFIDLVFFNMGANCTVHLNDGNGGFGSPVQSLAMNRSFDGKLADLNGDGHLDLAITDLFNPDQKIFINDGSGSFTFHSSVTVSTGLYSIAVADVDGDSLPDLICGVNGANQIFINDGSANFADSGQLFGTAGTSDIVAGDIDGDCDADLVATDVDGAFRVYRNDGGNFIEIAVNDDSGVALQLADVNHDDTLDLIVASGVPDMVHLNLGPGSDCNGNGIPDSVEISADPSLDCDGNGAIDLCEFSSDPFLDCDENGILDSCEGGFVDSGQALSNFSSEDVALGDFDGDGDLDAWVANRYTQSNHVWINDGSGNFTDSGQTLGNHDSFAVDIGDLDGDGDLDAWVANRNEPNHVWINDGFGNFTHSGQALGNSWSTSVSLGDLDGDGDLDAWVANYGQANRVWLNLGGDQGGTPGTFADSGQALGNSSSQDIILKDLDGDSDLDAWVTNYGQANRVWINQGGDQGGTPGIYADSGQALGSSNSIGAALGDLDGDGDVDAWVANYGQANRAWINQGGIQGGIPGIYADSGQPLGGSGSWRVALGDVDGDGDLDAWVANYGDSSGGQPNRVGLNDGSGNFADSGLALGNSPSAAVALGDLDGDGDLDAWVANTWNFTNPKNRVWINSYQFCNDCDGNGIQDSVEIAADPSIDCDENGAIDLCEISNDPSLDCDGNGVLDSCESVFVDSGQTLGNSFSEGVALGDLDGDGDLDAWVANIGIHQPNRVWINQGGAQGGTPGTYADSGQILLGIYRQSQDVALGDLDGDGDLDAYVANDDNDPNRLWINQGGAQGGTPGTYASGQALGNSRSEGVALGDLDGDGDLDAYVANNNYQANRVWINQGGAQGGTPGIYAASGQFLGNSSSADVALGDLDGDGHLDAYVANNDYHHSNRVWLNDGLGNFIDSGQALGNSWSQGVALGDLDGDGDLDAYVANGQNQPNRVWINDGFGNFIDNGPTPGNSSSSGVALGDLDGDGDLDAWVANSYSHANRVRINDGLGNFTSSSQALGTSWSEDVALGDLDGDGDLDAWVANLYSFMHPEPYSRVWINSSQFCNDCNGNGIQDSVEIAADPSLDCNANGVLDGCDIASGFSLDSDGSGVPDECEGMKYISGDSNGDGAVDVGDGIFVLDYLFAGGTSTCLDASDANGDGAVDIGDAIFVLTYLFSGGVAPAPPFPDCGEDPTADALECENFDGC